MIRAIAEAYRLKDETRTGWSLRGVEAPESVADHSWGTAYLVLLYAEEAGADRARAIEIALVHDIAEAITGDIPTRVRSMNERERADAKAHAESQAIRRLVATYSEQRRDRVIALWSEYEARATLEARLVRDMNLIDMCLQAFVYESAGRYADGPSEHFPDFAGLDEFFATTSPRLDLPIARALFAELLELYNSLPSVRDRGGVLLDPRSPD